MQIEEKYNKLINIFKEISKVPRNSKHEEKIANYLCEFAKTRGLEYSKDEYNNVLIKKSATKGYENKNTILFQAHTDMVCEKAIGSTHDFENDPIEIIEENGILMAKDTTLGADDGIGVAYLLLFLEDDEISHPNIECLFTTQEEIGMNGARAFDYSDIKAKYLINLDGEEENTAIVGCAGGVSIEYSKNIVISDMENEKAYILNISGLYGGHSGVEIDKGRINANYLAAKLLSILGDSRIISWKGGTKDNAIAKEAEVIFFTHNSDPMELMNEYIENMNITDEDIGLIVGAHEAKQKARFKAISKDETDNVLKLILGLKQNVIEWSKDIDGLVESSGNIGIIRVSDGDIKIIESLRSSIDSKKEEIKLYNNSLAKSLGFNISEEGDYPGWKYNSNSKLEKVYVEAYKSSHNGEFPIVCAIHAGVECGMIYEKLPHLEMISLGPDVKDVHTINERIYLSSCRTMLITLLNIINNLD